MKNSVGSKLGTFGGVFTPSLLTILGVIMYLRFGWVVGNVGLLGTLIIVTLSTLITFLTALSIASISTNAPVKAGGAYYMISRSLGVEIGGAVGIPLYLAQAFSVSLYVMGFSESLVAIFPSLDIRWVGIITTVVLGALSLYSTNATIKVQFVILGIIGISLISLVFGKPLENSEIEMWGVPAARAADFWQVFAIFFPAVTGIMAGVNLSGDLKNPSKSIPKGTFLAIGVGYVVYMLLPIVLASRADASTLVADPLIMRRIAIWGGAILLGIWGASLSSATGSLLGAPRVLQALAVDRVLPPYLSVFAKGSGDENIPRAGTLFTIGITLICVYFANLDIIAPILTMFFLTTYGVLNITAGIERFLKSPSFRPSFKVHWVFSLLGAIGCIAVMFLINALSTVIAIAFISLVFIWLQRRRLQTAWGDVRSGLLLTVIRYAVLRLEREIDPKSWRPNILVLSGTPTKRWHLVEFANALSQEKALFTVSTILPQEKVSQSKITDYEEKINDFLLDKNVQALVRVIRAQDPFTGGMQLVNSYGLGPVTPNTILLGDTQETGHHQAYAEMIGHFFQSKKNVIIIQNDHPDKVVPKNTVDIWWGGLKGNGGLMMIIGYLLKNSLLWREANIMIKMVVPNQSAADKAKENLSNILTNMRVGFDYKIIISNPKQDFWDIMNLESRDSDMVLIGMAPPEENFADYFENLKSKTSQLNQKVFVLAGQKIEFESVLS